MNNKKGRHTNIQRYRDRTTETTFCLSHEEEEGEMIKTFLVTTKS